MNTEQGIVVNPRERRRSQYREFEAGQHLFFPIFTIESDGTLTTTEDDATITAVKGGGFYGKVLFLEEKPFVLKTSLPGAGKHLLRTMNWDREFPGEKDELFVRAEHVATRLIHTVLPYVTDNKFYVPESHGYTKLNGRFAHIIEKVTGRGPRYDLSTDDYRRFKDAQAELVAIGAKLGLEQIGQIHPDNPLGLPNLWWNDERQQWIWVDTIAAFRHTGIVWPYPIPFDFHKQVREAFNQEEPTFNRIHTDRFRQEIATHYAEGTIPHDVYDSLQTDLALYDQLYAQSQAQHIPSQNITALLPPAQELARRVPHHVAEAVGEKLADPLINTGRTIFDRSYRKGRKDRRIQKALKGVHEAHERNIVSDEEYTAIVQEAYASNEDEKRGTFLQRHAMKAVGAYYTGVWVSINAAQAKLAYDALDDNPLKSLGFMAAGSIASPVARFVGTKTIGEVTGRNLDAAAWTSLIPLFGNFFPFLAQRAVDRNNNLSKTVWHYALLNRLTQLTKLHPSGGWGTDLQAKVWRVVGRRIERLGTAPQTEEARIEEQAVYEKEQPHSGMVIFPSYAITLPPIEGYSHDR